MDINKQAKLWAENNSGKTLEEAYIAGFIAHADFVEATNLKKEEKVKALKDKFYQELIPYVASYGKEMVREFYDYWCQRNKSGTNIKRYMETTWETELRLKTWAKNSDKFSGGSTIKEEKSSTPTKKLKFLN